jgi:polysaccharide biosynthesis transport protein
MNDDSTNGRPSEGSPGSVPAVRAVAGVPAAAEAAQTFDALALARALRRRWMLAVIAGVLLAAVTATAVWCLIPPSQYVSRTTMMITTYLPKIIFDTAEARADFLTYQRTQMALLKSEYILSAALRDPKVAALPSLREKEDRVEWLVKALKIEFANSSEILDISLSGDRPADLVTLLNAVTDTYMRLVVEEEHKTRLTRLDSLRKLWNKYQDELRAKRKSLRDLATAAGSTDRATLAMKQQLALENVSVAQQALMGLRPEILKAESDLKFQQTKEKEGAQDASQVARGFPAAAPAPRRGAMDDPEARSLNEQIAKLSRQLANNQRLARSGADPAITKVRVELNTARRALADRLARLEEVPAGGGGPGGSPADSPVAIARERLQVLRLYEEALKKDVEKFQEQSQSANLNTLDLQTEQDQIGLADATAKKIGSEVEAMDVELQAPPRIKLIDRAKVPSSKDETKRYKMTGAAGLGAFAVGLLGVSFWEFRTRRIGSVDEVVRELRLRLVGTLPIHPYRPGRRRPGSRTARAKDEELSRRCLIESIDATRTMLIHASRADSIRVVMVTSALKGEGKTTLASHLATSLARAGRKTLLIDCDFRRPAIHRLYGEATEPGLSEVLRGEAQAARVIRRSASKDLDVITAGRWDPLALQVLARDGARPIFERLRKNYDFLVIDTAPVLQVTDTLLLSQQVDAVIFSILRDVSCVPPVKAAYERLESLNVRMLGAVVNGTQLDGYYSYARD